MEMEKHQIAISSSSKRDKGTFPKDTPCSESLACYRVGSNRSTRSESPACKGASGLISMEELSFEQIDLFARETVDNAVSDTEGVVSQDAIIDLTEEDEEEEHSPGPSNADTQKRPREADASPTAPERKKGQVAVVAPTRTVEEAVDDGDRERMNNVQRWTDTQLNEWERASWNSKGSDELPPRGRQTPFAFQDLAEEEVETESLPEDRQNSVQIVERIDALREELINRQDSFFSEVLKRQDTFFNELLNRMDAQDARAHEQQGILNQQHQSSENRLRSLQTGVAENFGVVHDNLLEKLRERRLIVSLLSSLNDTLHIHISSFDADFSLF
ncbi:uncharacterized protein LOC131539206 [Onychostoma macrolepis]|uniref:uncharacterized protein LOC131539206 n=1 Tax=Onychostoma macrolepis TaxID=369639 RepID=UPI00272B0632|nr:uncharacterized protein LOC131539206 [Onychostoma macrolepis]